MRLLVSLLYLVLAVELGLVIGKGGRDISEGNAIDMTARNLQEEVKKKGLPWSTVKGFDTFTPIG